MIDLPDDPPKFADLRGVGGFVHQITRDYDERGPQAIDRRRDKLEVRRVLDEISIVAEHAHLRIAELDEEERFIGSGEASKQPSKSESDYEQQPDDFHSLQG